MLPLRRQAQPAFSNPPPSTLPLTASQITHAVRQTGCCGEHQVERIKGTAHCKAPVSTASFTGTPGVQTPRPLHPRTPPAFHRAVRPPAVAPVLQRSPLPGIILLHSAAKRRGAEEAIETPGPPAHPSVSNTERPKGSLARLSRRPRGGCSRETCCQSRRQGIRSSRSPTCACGSR